jgi:hypothetical protein
MIFLIVSGIPFRTRCNLVNKSVNLKFAPDTGSKNFGILGSSLFNFGSSFGSVRSLNLTPLVRDYGFGLRSLGRMSVSIFN